jgi:hypothetical protein
VKKKRAASKAAVNAVRRVSFISGFQFQVSGFP